MIIGKPCLKTIFNIAQYCVSVLRGMLQMQSSSSCAVLSMVALTSIARNGCFRMMRRTSTTA